VAILNTTDEILELMKETVRPVAHRMRSRIRILLGLINVQGSLFCPLLWQEVPCDEVPVITQS
jgi:hypothetical protein